MSRSERAGRGGSRAATVLLALGVSVTPVAALMIWFASGGGPLRAAAVLALLGTILIGLSVVLRRDSDGVRLELQENLIAEAAAIREDVRSAVITAMQRSNQSLHAEVAALQEQVDVLRAAAAGRQRHAASGAPVGTASGAPVGTGLPPGSAAAAFAPVGSGGHEPVRRGHRRLEEDELEHTGYGYHNPEYARGAPDYSSYSPSSSYRPQDYPAPAGDARASGRRRRHRAED